MKATLPAAVIENKYSLTRHAKKRVIERLGVISEQAINHVNQLMQTAYLQGHTKGRHGFCRVYDHPKTKTRLIVANDCDKIITVYKFPESVDKTGIRTDFLRPLLEREKRKIDRHYTRAIRKLELQYAENLRELADMAINRARARNPKTRELIAERMADRREEGERLTEKIERLQDEWKAKVKVIEVISE